MGGVQVGRRLVRVRADTLRQSLLSVAILGAILYVFWAGERSSRLYECEREAADLHTRGWPAADSLRSTITDAQRFAKGIANATAAERRSLERELLDSLHSAKQDADVLYGLIEYDMGACLR